MFNRVCYVEFITANGQAKRLNGIDIQFRIDKHMGAVMNEANVIIYNLTREDIEYLTTFTSQWIAYQQRKRIRIFAGYTDTSVGLIFDGDIIEALPSMPPDIALRCKARSGAYNNSTMISKSVTEPIAVKDLLQQASSWTGLTINDKTTTDKKVNGFYYTGSATQLISQLNDIPNIIVYEDDNALWAVDKTNTNIGLQTRIINKHSGMVDIPQPNALGIKVTVLLDPTIKLGQKIKVESSLIPACNGIYTVYELSHTGHLRGNDFYTEITARR
jgi:hypothetical protein